MGIQTAFFLMFLKLLYIERGMKRTNVQNIQSLGTYQTVLKYNANT